MRSVPTSQPSRISLHTPIAADNRLKLHSIQYLRALAATAVVFAHGSTSLFSTGKVLVPFDHLGAKGVDLFFVISGFLMFFTTDQKRMSPPEFLRKRLIRIVPLYFLFSTFGFLIATLSPRSFQMLTARPFDYLRSILFIPFFNVKVQLIRPELGQGWTLNYEMFFYLVFALSLLMPRKARIVFNAMVFAVLSVIGFLAHPTNPILATYCDSLTMEFVFGAVLAYLISNRQVSKRETASVAALCVFSIALVGLQVLVPMTAILLPPFVGTGIPVTAIVASALWLERTGKMRRVAFALLLGDASYSLYLSHVFVLGVIRRIWAREFNIDLIATHLTFMTFSAAVSIAAGIGVYLWIEKPITEFLTRRKIASKAAVGLASVTSS